MMTPEQNSQLDAELILSEGDKLFLYDDANGARIVPGYTLKGNPTAGTGTNLEFLWPEEDAYLLHNRERRAQLALIAALPWYTSLDYVRQNALVDLYYNVPAFVKWPHFIGFCAAGDWSNAAAELLATQPWASQVGQRAVRIANALRAGISVVQTVS